MPFWWNQLRSLITICTVNGLYEGDILPKKNVIIKPSVCTSGGHAA